MKLIRILLPVILFIAQFNALATDVRVGLASNLSEVSSSNSNPYGDSFRKGVQLALRDASGKLKKKNINIIFDEFDYGTNQARVADAVKKALTSQVSVVLGYNLSPQALIAAPIHHQAKLPMMSSSSSANRLGTVGDYIHLASFSNEYMGKTLASVALKRLKAKKAIVIVAEDCAYCTDLADAFEAEFKKHDGLVIGHFGVLDSQTDFSKLISDSRLKEADVIVVPNYELNSVRVISALVDSGVSAPFIGGDGWGNVGEEFYRILGARKLAGYSLSHWHPDLKDQKSAQFRKAFVAAYKTEPNDTAVLAYDAMNLILESILRTKRYDRAGIEDSLNRIRSFGGVTGTFRYPDPHRAPEKSIVLLKAGDGKFEIVDRINPITHGGGR